jgi:hypothetical protein
VKFFRAKVLLWPILLVIVLFAGLVTAVAALGMTTGGGLSLFGTNTTIRSTQVIKEVLPAQEVALARLRVQGVEKGDEKGNVLGVAIPAGDRTKYLFYQFDAKLGIDGSQVEIVAGATENSYIVRVPAFIFIGHSNEHFDDPIEQNGLLSILTKEISETDLINRILSDDKKSEYVSNSVDVLKDQARAFYGGIISSVDPGITLEFEFAN